MRKITSLPHKGVCTRIQPSKIHGVGVFAIKNIKKGTEIFYGDNSKTRRVTRNKLRGLPKEVRRLYDDFCIIKNKGQLYESPQHFNSMTMSWYLNESKTSPNVGCDKRYNFYALRDIKTGEELTVDYRTFSEEPPRNNFKSPHKQVRRKR